MKTSGYPAFRLPLDVVQRENALVEWGVETHFGVALDSCRVRRMLSESDAVVAATGKFKGVRPVIPGEDLSGAYDALDFLTRVKLGRPFTLGARVASRCWARATPRKTHRAPRGVWAARRRSTIAVWKRTCRCGRSGGLFI
ncbi:MAG: hypothetical protein ACREFQ_04380 [Stellaceae bacterium]